MKKRPNDDFPSVIEKYMLKPEDFLLEPERLLLKLLVLGEKLGCGLFETIVEVCDRGGYEMEDIIESFDRHMLDLLKLDAIEHNRVRKKNVEPIAKLPLI